jgi:hypothetical protein
MKRDAVMQAITEEISRVCDDICVDNTLQALVWRAVRD